MDAAFFVLAGSLLVGFIGGMVAGLGFRLASARRATRLEWAVGDLQERMATFKGKAASKVRWDKEAQLDAQMEQVLHNVPATRPKYDNDPLG
jgi:uncharacterized membrane protein YgaE (UPF0421/DUF939 family)